MKKSKGIWKKERTTGRKYSKSDVHPEPRAHTRKKFWVSGYIRQGKKIKGYYKINSYYK